MSGLKTTQELLAETPVRRLAIHGSDGFCIYGRDWRSLLYEHQPWAERGTQGEGDYWKRLAIVTPLLLLNREKILYLLGSMGNCYRTMLYLRLCNLFFALQDYSDTTVSKQVAKGNCT